MVRRKGEVCKTCNGYERRKHRVTQARLFYRQLDDQWKWLCPACWAKVVALDQAQMQQFMRRRRGRPRTLPEPVSRYSLERRE